MTGTKIQIRPEIVRWAVERSGLSVDDLRKDFPTIGTILQSGQFASMKRVEAFAKKTMIPLGYLFLKKPIEEPMPFGNFRTVGSRPVRRPSPGLIGTVYEMQRRQDWMREYLKEEDYPIVDFVGSLSSMMESQEASQKIANFLDIDESFWERGKDNCSEIRRFLIDRIQEKRVMVSLSGVVQQNSRRPFDVKEFRGFTLCDQYAPLIFINGKDVVCAQIFTIIHELVHIGIGSDYLVDDSDGMYSSNECFCNAVAAEFLVPMVHLKRLWNNSGKDLSAIADIAQRFHVSRAVISRRLYDYQLLPEKYAAMQSLPEIDEDETTLVHTNLPNRGGNYYRVANLRVGFYFFNYVYQAVNSGSLLWRDAYQLTGLSRKSFDGYVRHLREK